VTSENTSNYNQFAEQLVQGGVLLDPWYEGQPRFQADPVIVAKDTAAALGAAAEEVAGVYNELCQICARQPELIDDYFALTPFQKLMWASSSPAWHGIARADFFETADGLRMCELNCDTPTGEAEAVGTSALAAASASDAVDPNETIEQRFCEMVDALASATLEPGFAKTAGLVYPTELTDDLPLVRIYQRWLEARGWRVVLGSPFNLKLAKDGGVRLLGEPCSVIVRHYKTDWWGERSPPWLDEAPYADDQPLDRQLAVLIEASVDNKVVVINPFGSVLPQNKKSMAFMWENKHLFSEASQKIIEAFVPVTARLEGVHKEQLSAQRDDWVLKSDYGAEGNEVVIGKLVSQEVWQESLANAAPGRWIAQKYFQATPNDAAETVNLGVFVVGGQASGLYARISRGPTDEYARSAPTLVQR
jgi:glutathionylspermidine synthase